MGLEKTDKQGYDEHYKNKNSPLILCASPSEFVEKARAGLTAFYKGGSTKGYVRGVAVQALIQATERKKKNPSDIHVMDAGSGTGELSVYLACLGFRVTGIDISVQAQQASSKLAQKIGVTENCVFLAESLECVSLQDESIDFVIGHASLHHFIKYEGVPRELNRILKPGGEMFFADSFGENKAYHLFHDKEKMQRLGDVILTRNLITQYFKSWDVKLLPTDWFVMLDKLFLKFLPKYIVKKLSFIFWHLDRLIPNNRFTLYFSGAVMTTVKKSV